MRAHQIGPARDVRRKRGGPVEIHVDGKKIWTQDAKGRLTLIAIENSLDVLRLSAELAEAYLGLLDEEMKRIRKSRE